LLKPWYYIRSTCSIEQVLQFERFAKGVIKTWITHYPVRPIGADDSYQTITFGLDNYNGRWKCYDIVLKLADVVQLSSNECNILFLPMSGILCPGFTGVLITFESEYLEDQLKSGRLEQIKHSRIPEEK
jgi:hypothetical protein